MSELSERVFVHPDDVETLLTAWGAMKWLAGPQINGSQHVSVAVEIIQPGEERPRTHYPQTDILLYVISGCGEQTVGADKGRLQPGTVVRIPAGTYHSTLNTGWEPLKLLLISSPPGIETEMRASEDVRIVPPRKPSEHS